ncbi:hypothetical protein [Brevundimonas sp.]|uniref:hypothetical protein n=1 Tax=Brevundimonas sp. TaxID=1871086 RepID=UPI0037C17C0B
MRAMSLMAALVVAVVSVGLMACEPADPPSNKAGASPAPTPMSVARAQARPTGPGAASPAVSTEEMGTAADVSQFQALPALNAKVFSLSGGDPAANGLVTYFALFGGPAEGWRAYAVGDYVEWKMTEARAGRVVLAVKQEAAGPDGNIRSQSRHVFIDFAWDGETPPETVTVNTGP